VEKRHKGKKKVNYSDLKEKDRRHSFWAKNPWGENTSSYFGKKCVRWGMEKKKQEKGRIVNH